jgi:biopolymer transport protein ExbD
MNIRRRRRSQNIDAIVNVTSLIDVTFILLIFFMITTTFAKPNKQLPMITLPEATNVETQKKQADIEVIIDDKGNYHINGQQLMSNDISSLSRALEKEKENKKDAYVLIKGDEKTTYQSVINVFDAITKLSMGVTLNYDNTSPVIPNLVKLLESEKKKLAKNETTLAIKVDAKSTIHTFANMMEAAKRANLEKLQLSIPVIPRKEH